MPKWFNGLLKNSASATCCISNWSLAPLKVCRSCLQASLKHGRTDPRNLTSTRSTATAARRNRRRLEKNPSRLGGSLGDEYVSTTRPEWLTLAKPPTKPPEPRKKSLEGWVELMEPFLPSELRSLGFKGALYHIDEDSSSNKQVLATILHDARLQEHGDLDVLAHMGLTQHRWKAVMWLVDILLDETQLTSTPEKEVSLLSNIAWPNQSQRGSLRELCEGPLDVSYLIGQETRSLTSLTSDLSTIKESNGKVENNLAGNIMREVWQSMGTIAIEAASLAPDDMRSVMGWIYQMIGQLHHRGLIPDAVYQFQLKDNTSTVTRSPVIYLLSTRILSALSDTVFTKESREIPGMAYRLKGGDPYPNIWLEFILWCCIDSGFIEESSWILTQLQSHKSRHEWRVIDWQNFEQKSLNKTGWIFRTGKAKLRQEFLEQTESRTISRQVIFATIDGLINCFQRFDDLGEALRQPLLQKRIFQLLSCLGEQEDTAPTPMTLNRLLVRMRETPGFILQLFPGSVWHVVHDIQENRLVEQQQPEPMLLETFASPLQFETIMQNTDPIFTTLHQTLEQFSRQGDVRRALSTFDTIQFFIDQSRRRTIDLFAQRLRSSQDRHATSDDAADEGYFLPHGQPSPRVLGRFLEVLTYAGRFDIGRWLLYSADPDGPIINPALYGIPQLSPALIRFAQATNDTQLLSRVLQASRSQISTAFLYSLLSARFWFHQFDLAEHLLRQFKDTEEGAKGEVAGHRIASVASLAASIIRLGNVAKGKEEANVKLQTATSVFQKIFHGEFSNAFNYGRDFQNYRQNRNAALLRILQSFPNPLQDFAVHLMPSYEFRGEALLPPQAFNILLSVVVESRGAIAGKCIYDEFCKEPEEPASDQPHGNTILEVDYDSTGSEDPSAEAWWASYTQPLWNEPIRRGHRVISEDTIPFKEPFSQIKKNSIAVRPDVWTVRMIVNAALKEIRHTDLVGSNNQELQPILEWSVGVFRKFGLKISDIIHELGPESARRDFLPRKKIAAILYGR